MSILRLAFRSIWNRRVTTGLTVLAIALSVAMLLGVEKLRRDTRGAFASTISGTDLVVGARSGAVQLLLYSVFRIGNATNNISWESYEDIARHPKIGWTVPISLGDSHHGFRVMGTTNDYFEHYRYARDVRLDFSSGVPFEDVFETVLGAEVAEQLGYQLGDEIVVAHGTGDVSLVKHDDKPFRVVGVLEPTRTAVDRTVHVSLEGIEAMHVGWRAGAPLPGQAISAEEARARDLTPKNITAFLVGLDSKLSIFRVQRHINQYPQEALLAIIPGVALQEFWDLLGVAENALRFVSVMVVATGLLGMLTVIVSSLEARRREMAILRSVGARPLHVFSLFMSESGLLSLTGVVVGVTLFYALLAAGRQLVVSAFGIHLPLSVPSSTDLLLLGCVVLAGVATGFLPAIRAYRVSLADGLSIRI